MSAALLFFLPKLPTLENLSSPEHHFVMILPFNLSSTSLLLPTLQDRRVQATLSRPLEKTRDNVKSSFFVLDAEFFGRFYSLLAPATNVFSESLNQPDRHNQLLNLAVHKQEHAELSSLRS
jgi:hypothetical protein